MDNAQNSDSYSECSLNEKVKLIGLIRVCGGSSTI
jgi:hypothetical protein